MGEREIVSASTAECEFYNLYFNNCLVKLVACECLNMAWSLYIMGLKLFDSLRNGIMHSTMHFASSPSDFGFWKVVVFWARSNGWELTRIGECGPMLEPRRNHCRGRITCVRPCSGVVPRMADAQVESFPDIEASRCWRLRIPNSRGGRNFTTLIMWLNIHAFIWLLTNLFAARHDSTKRLVDKR